MREIELPRSVRRVTTSSLAIPGPSDDRESELLSFRLMRARVMRLHQPLTVYVLDKWGALDYRKPTTVMCIECTDEKVVESYKNDEGSAPFVPHPCNTVRALGLPNG